MYPQEQRLKGVIYIAVCSSCRTYNLSVCYLPLEIVVCVIFERIENSNNKGQHSALRILGPLTQLVRVAHS